MPNHNILWAKLFGMSLIFFLPQYAEGAMTIQYRIFGFHNKNPQVSLDEIHPLLAGGQHGYIALTSQEGNILKVAFYYDESLKSCARLFYIPNPSHRDFTGIPARYVTDSQGRGIMFADGTVLYSSFPSDARPMGTSEWMYEMRWRRVYQNYYIITVFRGTGAAIKENLMTEKDGKDLTPVLGDSSVDRDLEDMGGSISADMVLECPVKEDGQIKYIRYNLIPVYEKDLPPDFPEGVVRWLP